ncbi:MAG: 2-amino-4-hydroxy-6-hydroxymethyldihydropteridine diphosphokinase [bacterium]
MSLTDAKSSLATISIGSNVGDRRHYLEGSLRWLLAHEQNRLHKCSSVYETEPFGVRDQGWFLNCVAQLDTALPLKELFRMLQQAEAAFGRERTRRWGPRTLDLDLLFFDDLVYQDPTLTVPHPGIPNRRFVLEPLFEIDPDLIHPNLHLSIRGLLERVADPCRVVRVAGPPCQDS